jgi:hypothetical protein
MFALVAAILGIYTEPVPHSLAQSDVRLSGKEISTLLTGKRIAVRHNRNIEGTADSPVFVTRSDGSVSELIFVFRSDGSYRRLCENIARNSDRFKCIGVFKDVSSGTWAVRENMFCIQDLIAFATRDVCYGVARAGSKYRLHYAGAGPMRGVSRSLLDGMEFEVKP